MIRSDRRTALSEASDQQPVIRAPDISAPMSQVDRVAIAASALARWGAMRTAFSELRERPLYRRRAYVVAEERHEVVHQDFLLPQVQSEFTKPLLVMRLQSRAKGLVQISDRA